MIAARYFCDGWRLGVVYAEGPKFVSLLDVGLLRDVKVQKAQSRWLRPVDVPPRRLARAIERRHKTLKRCHVAHAAKLARRVADDLRRAP